MVHRLRTVEVQDLLHCLLNPGIHFRLDLVLELSLQPLVQVFR